MKKTILILMFAFLIAACGNKKEHLKVATFKVWGNCEMCKKTIESAINKEPAIYAANWNTETKLIKVEFDSVKINLDEIQNKIALVGYDTEKTTGSDSAYAQLHACCQYDRKVK